MRRSAAGSRRWRPADVAKYPERGRPARHREGLPPDATGRWTAFRRGLDCACSSAKRKRPFVCPLRRKLPDRPVACRSDGLKSPAPETAMWCPWREVFPAGRFIFAETIGEKALPATRKRGPLPPRSDPQPDASARPTLPLFPSSAWEPSLLAHDHPAFHLWSQNRPPGSTPCPPLPPRLADFGAGDWLPPAAPLLACQVTGEVSAFNKHGPHSCLSPNALACPDSSPDRATAF